MASYTFRSLEDRRKIQSMWESGLTAKDIADEMGMSLSTAYYELKRGQDGTRLPDKRLRYDAETAQLNVQRSLERRGRRAAKA